MVVEITNVYGSILKDGATFVPNFCTNQLSCNQEIIASVVSITAGLARLAAQTRSNATWAHTSPSKSPCWPHALATKPFCCLMYLLPY